MGAVQQLLLATGLVGGGPSNFVNDTFSGEGSQVDVTTHTGETGATWAYHPSDINATVFVTTAGRAWSTLGDGAVFASGVPGSADYTVESNGVFIGASDTSISACTGRMNTTTTDWYGVEYDSSTDLVSLIKVVASVRTVLGSSVAYTASVNDTWDSKLVMTGTTITATHQINGGGYTSIASVSDSAHSAAGRVGMYFRGAASATTGMHITRIFAY